MPTQHYKKVKEFMKKAGQETPDTPVVPSEEVRLLRAKLIMEEAIETIEALGFAVRCSETKALLGYGGMEFVAEFEPNLVEIADGCADIRVVTTGTLIACGIDDEPLQNVIDESNLEKFGEGSYKREDGKWMKPPTWKAPNIQAILAMQEMAVAILGELTHRPITWIRLWQRLGSPEGDQAKAFDNAIVWLVKTARVHKVPGRSNTEVAFYV